MMNISSALKLKSSNFMESVIIGSLILIFISSILVTGKTIGPSSDDDFIEKILTSEDDCNETIKMNSTSEGYSLIMNLTPSQNCSSNRRGFNCRQKFFVPDRFDLVGHRLCVDLQGVEDTLRQQCQLNLDVLSSLSKTMKGVYCSTRLKPDDSPYYVCTDGDQLTLSLTTLRRLLVCPHVMEYLFNHKVYMGAVSLKPTLPTYDVDLASCESQELPADDFYSFVVRVDASNYGSQRCSMFRKSMVKKLDYNKMRGCLTLLYVSKDYSCSIDLTLDSYRDISSLELQVRRDAKHTLSERPKAMCRDFDADNGDVELKIWAYQQKTICSGKMAFQVSLRSLSDDGDDLPEDSSPKRVIIAVFIILIVICLICLGLTCLCCIRFRTKRMRNAQRRSRHGAPTPNNGFDDPVVSGPPYDSNISWSQTEPGAIYGLPSYEDVAGERTSGINPGGESSQKEDMPPSYDSLFTSDS